MTEDAIVEINEINMYERFRALLSEPYSVQPPIPKTFFQDVPGADGSLDLSTAISGRTIYERREIIMKFCCLQPSASWPGVLSEIMREFHGKEGKIIFGNDMGYYYIGRLSVSDYERNGEVGQFVITANADPYKYERSSSMDPWIWDTFNFETGVIREYSDLIVNGTETIVIHGTEKWIIPNFIVSGTINVMFEGNTYQLKAGTTKNYMIAIKPGKNYLQFSGNGVVSIDYRGGIL